MNLAQIKCLSVFAVFAIIGFGPISPGCLIGMVVVLMRPKWFLALTLAIYRRHCGKSRLEDLDNSTYVENARIRGCKKFCVNRHFAGNCNFQKWNKNDYTIIIT